MIFYGPEEAPEAQKLGQKSPESTTRVEGASTPLVRAPYLVADSWIPRRETDAKNSYKSRNPRNKPRSGVPLPQASVATKNQSGPCSGTLPEGGGTSTGGHLHHPGALCWCQNRRISGRVPEQGPDWFLVATKACGGGTPDLLCFIEVSVFIGIFLKLLRSPTPPPSWAPRGSPDRLLSPIYVHIP